MKQPRWISRYVGVPFCDDGLTLSGCHCWGLVRLVLENEARIQVPDYGENSAADLLAASRHFRDGAQSWPQAIAPLRVFDVVLMTAMELVNGVTHRLPAHCGVMVSQTHLLHVWKETASVIMPLDHPRIRHKVVGIYRHKDLNELAA